MDSHDRKPVFMTVELFIVNEINNKNPFLMIILRPIFTNNLKPTFKISKKNKKSIPETYHNDIETEEERTRNYHDRVIKKEVIDYDTLKNEFESEKKKFNKIIKDLERVIRRLNGEIREKDKDIEMLHKMLEKDNEISRLRRDYLREIDEFSARECVMSTEVCEIVNKNARLKKEYSKLKEFEIERTENIRKVEVKESEEHEQGQIDEDNSEEMYSWWRGEIFALNQIANEDRAMNE
ncbi:6879_t:CDS:2 [Gigaspora margarita]|uniref:6879_t:CDS:1 n=1 Tax=Gigaspora margarita TaxID=4874 RepID=A0ABN7VET4_GIGMA|nr:6879_t:CDS:2 [Gigaspora margarita]